MNPDEALTTLEKLLREETSAIVHLDAERVERIAKEKEAVMGALKDARPPLDDEGRGRLRALRGSLQQNALLLANARDCLQDALRAFQMGSLHPRASSQPPALRAGLRLSIVG